MGVRRHCTSCSIFALSAHDKNRVFSQKGAIMSQIDRKADRHTRRRIMFMMAVFCVLCASAVIVRLAFLQIVN